MKNNIVQLNQKDNVAVALITIKEGETAIGLQGETFKALTEIPYGHKIALEDISKGNLIIKYGEIIGSSNCDIKKGEWIHTHNLGDEGSCK